MKVTRNLTPNFTPRVLSIIIESAEEAQALYAIFNHTNNVAVLPSGAAQDIKDAIGNEHYVCRRSAWIANGITAGTFYR